MKYFFLNIIFTLWQRVPPKNKLQVPGRWRTISNEPLQI